MGKYKTKAIQAAEQINKLLNDNKNIYRPWGLASMHLENRTLDCIAEEAEIIYKNNSNVRPGYDVSDETAYVPNLFVKFSGIDDSSKYFYNLLGQKPQKNTYIYDNCKGFCTSPLIINNLEEFIDEKKELDMDSLLQSDIFPYSFLRREYQHLLINKIDDILKNQAQYFNNKLVKTPKDDLLSYLLSIDLTLITAFNAFDFALKPPAVIINNSKRIRFKPRQTATLLLLNLLGFDIIILSGKGYSDVENEIHEDIYSLFYGEKIASTKRITRKGKLFIATAAAVIITTASILLPGFLKNDNLVTPVNTDQNQTTQIDDIKYTEIDSTEVHEDNTDTEKVVLEPMVVTKSKNSGEVTDLCEIRIYVNGPDGNPLDISKASIVVQNGDLYHSVDELLQRNSSNISGKEMWITRPYRNFTIHITKEYGNLNYVISQDFSDYGYLITGSVLLGDYSEYDLIEITYNVSEFNNEEISIIDNPGINTPLHYSLLPKEIPLDRSDNAASCKGKFESEMKTFYSNTDLCEFRLYGSLNDAIFITSDSLSFKDITNTEISLNFSDYYQYDISINPDLHAYSYYCLKDATTGFWFNYWGILPKESDIKLYLNESIRSYYLTLSKTALFRTDNSIRDIELKENIRIGYDSYISHISVYKSYYGELMLNAFLMDNDHNMYRKLGYGYEDKRLDPYAMKLEYFQHGNLLLTELYNIQNDIFKPQLENGSYTVKVSPARENEIYSLSSTFDLVVDDTKDVAYNFVLHEYD